jgi:prophage regulatory protein
MEFNKVYPDLVTFTNSGAAMPVSLPTTKPPIFLRLPAVMARTGLSRSSLYLRMNKGEFPAAHALGPRMIAWLESDVDQWMSNVVAGAFKAAPPPAHAER